MTSRPENTCWVITSIGRALPQVAASAAQPDSAVGDFAGAFAAAPVQLDVTYTTPFAKSRHDGAACHSRRVERRQTHLYTANQMLSQGRDSVARTLKMLPEMCGL